VDHRRALELAQRGAGVQAGRTHTGCTGLARIVASSGTLIWIIGQTTGRGRANWASPRPAGLTSGSPRVGCPRTAARRGRPRCLCPPPKTLSPIRPGGSFKCAIYTGSILLLCGPHTIAICMLH
jgi:hypothetical protein